MPDQSDLQQVRERPPSAPNGGRRRKRLDESRRSRRAYVKFDDEEWTAATTGAADRGLALGAFAARATLAAAAGLPAPAPIARRERLTRDTLDELRALRVQFVRTGTLLNQAVKLTNATGRVAPGLGVLAGRVDVSIAQIDRLVAELHGGKR